MAEMLSPNLMVEEKEETEVFQLLCLQLHLVFVTL